MSRDYMTGIAKHLLPITTHGNLGKNVYKLHYAKLNRITKKITKETIRHCTSVREPIRRCTCVREPSRHCTSVREPIRHRTSVREPIRHCNSVREPIRHCTSVRHFYSLKSRHTNTLWFIHTLKQSGKASIQDFLRLLLILNRDTISLLSIYNFHMSAYGLHFVNSMMSSISAVLLSVLTFPSPANQQW